MHPIVSHILANPHLRAAVERGLAARGVNGDTLLAHINAHEAAMLKAAGGSGSINPKTGLRQFDPTGGSNAGGAGHAGDSGHMGGMGDGGSGRVGGGLNGGGYGPVMGGASGAYNSTSQLAARDPITSASLANQRTYGSDSGPLGYLGRAFLGLGYMDPTDMNRAALTSGVAPPTSPDTGFDAPGMALGIGGAFAGLPLGAGYLAGKTLFGAPKDFGMVDVGNWGNMGSWGSGAPGHTNASGATGGGQHDGSAGGPLMGNGQPATLPGGAPGAGGLPGGTGTPPGTTGPLMGSGQAQALLALMSQASPNLVGNRYGPVPSWATTPYQIGTIPAVNQPPRIPGTPFA